MRSFLSYNKADNEVARSIGAHMVLAGIDVWFDEWEIQAGDSIPGKLNVKGVKSALGSSGSRRAGRPIYFFARPRR